MDYLIPIVNAVVVAAATLLVVWVGKERSDALERRLDQGFAQVGKRFELVDKRFEQVGRELGEIRSEMSVLRSDITHVAMAVGARPQPNAG